MITAYLIKCVLVLAIHNPGKSAAIAQGLQVLSPPVSFPLEDSRLASRKLRHRQLLV